MLIWVYLEKAIEALGKSMQEEAGGRGGEEGSVTAF